VLAAVYYNQPAIADRLVEKGAHLNVFESAATGQLPRLRQLVNEKPELVNAFAIDGFQPLGLAAFFWASGSNPVFIGKRRQGKFGLEEPA